MKVLMVGSPQPGNGGSVRFHASDGRGYVDLREDQIVGRELLEDSPGRVPKWLIALPAGSDVEVGELSEDEWRGLFAVSARLVQERPSIHNSWCRQCTSYGVSHGVCCP